jgi:Dam-replacing HTH domain
MITKIIPGYSNWEIIVFIIISKLIVGNNRYFRRSEIMTTDNIKLAEMISAALGHKIKPRHPEETLQRNLQNMRDKGFIKFLGSGEYKLTNEGFNSMKIIAEKFPYNQLMKAAKE